ncbi:MAG TPA: hypothetical protein VLK59_00665 [Solirubrobacteraceae bacterium]|nr:hypothetical protein [Solirubrobacteraceae bacterium]
MHRDDKTRIGVRSLSLIALLLMAALLAACGGQSKPAAVPGSPERPLVAQTPQDALTSGRLNEATPAAKGTAAEGAKPKADAQPGYQKLVERQGSKPRSRFTPCNLVTKAQAGAIVGAPLQDPLEAPQGPTCIYRSKDGKRFVTLAVQSVPFSKLKHRMHKRQQVAVSNKTAFCGMLGQPILYVPLSGSRVLSVAAPCQVARKFAARAVLRLND